jgi:hypothetical protein
MRTKQRAQADHQRSFTARRGEHWSSTFETPTAISYSFYRWLEP